MSGGARPIVPRKRLSNRCRWLDGSLVVRTTGLSPMVDADATNFEIALQYVQHNLSTQFADMGSNGFEVRRHYEDVIDKLDMRGACKSWRCAPVLRTLPAWQHRCVGVEHEEHPAVDNGIGVLSVLYWLSNDKMLDAAPMPACSAGSGRRATRPRSRVRAHCGADGACQMGYSDERRRRDDDDERGRCRRAS